MTIRVLTVDHEPLISQGIAALLRQVDDIEVIDQAPSGTEAVDKAFRLQPDVVLIEVAMPSGDGLDTVRAIRQRCPQTNILVLTKLDDAEAAMEAIQAGAVGYVLKDIKPTDLLSAIRNVDSGKTMLNPRLARYMIARLAMGEGPPVAGDDIRIKALSYREIEVLVAVTRGMRDREIAQTLFLSVSTVKSHLKAIYRKLAVRNRAQAAALAARTGHVASADRHL